jgi:glucosyl-3-phosphoglycerate synthase
MPELGPVLGKGDAMWRPLSVLDGDVICFLDADTEHFGPHFACGLLGPLLCVPEISFVKSFYRRLVYPDLAAVQQPLAGEIAARRELLERLPFVTGYGVDIGLLLDAHRAAGLEAIAQVDLDLRQNAHQPLREHAPMAFSVLRALACRLERDGRLVGPLPSAFLCPAQDELRVLAAESVERLPIAALRAAA